MIYKFSIKAILLSLVLLNACQQNRNPYIACGGAMNATCPIGFFCKLSDDCGGIDRNGICWPIPERCQEVEEKICGCDNKEYLNECTANILSVTVKNSGSCIKKPTIETSNDND